jgi:hypothetical protein
MFLANINSMYCITNSKMNYLINYISDVKIRLFFTVLYMYKMYKCRILTVSIKLWYNKLLYNYEQRRPTYLSFILSKPKYQTYTYGIPYI